MATLSLAERAKMIERRIQQRFTVYQLRELYKKHGVKKKVVLVTRTWRKPEDEKKLRSDNECLQLLKEAVSRCELSGEEFIMADEYLFN